MHSGRQVLGRSPLVPDDIQILEAHILLVDDLAANLVLLEQVLRGAGYQHLTFTQDPYAVCELHRIHDYDLILLDLQMPGMNGFEVMKGLRRMDPGGYAPVLAITAQPEHKLHALKAGARDFIAKPFNLTELTSRIHNLVEVRLLYKKLEQTVDTLASFALHDALTGLPNRRLLLDRLAQSRSTSARTRHHAALMFLDIDHFKQINDTLGHDAGDALLTQMSGRLLSCARKGDTVARFGGDEFVLLVDALSSQAPEAATQARGIAQKILHALQQPYCLNGHACNSSLSVGILIFRGDAEPVDELLKKADLAMYQAKSKGRNRLFFYDARLQAAVSPGDALTCFSGEI